MGNRSSAPFIEVHIKNGNKCEELLPKVFNYQTSEAEVLNHIKCELSKGCCDSGGKLRVTLMTHGYMSHIRNRREPFYEIKDAILSRTEAPHVFILIDWSLMAGAFLNYRGAVRNVPLVGEWIGSYVVKLKEEFPNGLYIHGIGFSLGAHIMASIAEAAERKLGHNKAFDRITGLDPAGPLVVFKGHLWGLVKHQTMQLSDTHAHLVDVIHTSDHLGTKVPMGHVDFYPNWGNIQMTVWESGYLNHRGHMFCLKLFLETILNPQLFTPILPIRSLDQRKLNEEASHPQEHLSIGYFCPEGAKGMYYVDVPLSLST